MNTEKVLAAVTSVGDPWKNHPYYEEVEKYMESLWSSCIWPHIQKCDFTAVMDLAAGHGRNSVPLSQHAGRITIVDIHGENVEFCRNRFAGDTRFTFIQNDGLTLKEIPTGSLSLAYCFDAMVHFDSDVVRSYLAEIARVLQPGGHGFIHHSNYTGNPTGTYQDNPGWRNFMSKELFAHYCAKEGLVVLEQEVMDWSAPKSDCVTLFQKHANG
ncbi:MAG: class I SAM-dependent methyltransferase [Verrucomicrobiota bacterium]|nr:class I SAM-dependent methyltransferase [Verrucomicrobiota bacterium]